MHGSHPQLIARSDCLTLWPAPRRQESKCRHARSAPWLPRTVDIRKVCRVAPSIRRLSQIHPYPAKMFGEISAAVLLEARRLTRVPTLLDMMCGTGTSLMYGRLLGWRAVGIDVNPLAVLVSTVKTSDYTREGLENVAHRFQEALSQTGAADGKPILQSPEYSTLRYWYATRVLEALARLRVAVDTTRTSSRHKAILRMCLARTARVVSKADPEVVPPTISKRWRRSLASNPSPKPIQTFFRSLRATVETLRAALGSYAAPQARVIQADARNTGLPSHSVDLCFFSPPYFTAHDYVRSTRLEILASGLTSIAELAEIRGKTIGQMRAGVRSTSPPPRMRIGECDRFLQVLHSRSTVRGYHLKSYLDGMQQVLSEANRLLQSSGHLVLVVGDGTSRGIYVPLARLLCAIAAEEGFTLARRPVRNDIISRGFMTKRNSTAGVIESEWILEFRTNGVS